MKRFILDGLTMSQNPYERMNRWQRKDYRDEWYWLVKAAAGYAEEKAQSPRRIRILRISKRLIDDQNIPAATKQLVDAFVHYGWLYDDSRLWARITWDQRKCEAGEQPHMEVTIEEWAGD